MMEPLLREVIAHLEGDAKTWDSISVDFHDSNPKFSERAMEEANSDRKLIRRIKEVAL